MPQPPTDIWTLQHPKYGDLEVHIQPLIVAADGDHRLKKLISQVSGLSAELKRNGATVSRIVDLDDSLRIRKKPIKDDDFDDGTSFGPSVEISRHSLTDEIYAVTLEDGESSIEFAAPHNTKAARRQEHYAEHPWRAALAPLGSGLGAALTTLLAYLVFMWAPFLPDPVEKSSQLVDFIFGLFDSRTPEWINSWIRYSPLWVPILAGFISAIAARNSAVETRAFRQKTAE